MKEKILWAGVGAVGFLVLRGLAEYVITEAHWPQFAKDIGLFFTQNHLVLWTIWGGAGVFIGWHGPEAFAEQERGSVKIVELARSDLAKLS